MRPSRRSRDVGAIGRHLYLQASGKAIRPKRPSLRQGGGAQSRHALQQASLESITMWRNRGAHAERSIARRKISIANLLGPMRNTTRHCKPQHLTSPNVTNSIVQLSVQEILRILKMTWMHRWDMFCFKHETLSNIRSWFQMTTAHRVANQTLQAI